MHRATDRLRLIAIAVGGVFAGHAVALALPGAAEHVHPDGLVHGHDAMHGYLPAAMAIALPVAAVALISLAVRSLRTRDGFALLPRLMQLQVALFVVLEVSEHLVAGVPIETLLDAPALWLGVAAQLVVSGTMAAFAMVAAHAAGVLRPAIRQVETLVAETPISRPPVLTTLPTLQLADSISRRGPPLFLGTT